MSKLANKEGLFNEMAAILIEKGQKIQRSHGGWWDAYVGSLDRKIVEMGMLLEKLDDKKRKSSD